MDDMLLWVAIIAAAVRVFGFPWLETFADGTWQKRTFKILKVIEAGFVCVLVYSYLLLVLYFFYRSLCTIRF